MFNDINLTRQVIDFGNRGILQVAASADARSKGGDTEGLMAKLCAAREHVAKVTGRTTMVTLCYEAGYDGFWLARLLEQRGIGCLVMKPASLQVNRRARRVKTVRIDVESLLHTLIAWCRGERHVCSMVVIPRGISMPTKWICLQKRHLSWTQNMPLMLSRIEWHVSSKYRHIHCLHC